MTDSTALIAPNEPTALMPISMGNTFHAYTSMQREIDKAMPDQIMTIQGRQFRKKGYWRAVRAAFSLKVECMLEERIDLPSGDWGYSVLYRASGPNGMSADGDGVCMVTEKRGPGQGTVHNVRSHAHTRAFNRAVSNLVGFGEVSAEEMDRGEIVEAHAVPVPQPTPAPRVAPPETIPFDDEPVFVVENDPVHSVYVTKLDKRSGEKNGKPWTQHFIELSDGRKGSFFNGELGVSAQAALASKTPVVATFEQSGRYVNLVSLIAV